MIAFERVSLAYGPATIIEDVSLAIDAGAFHVLVGPSGAGKSTLLRMVNRLAAPTRGTVRFLGDDVAALPAAALRRRMGYVIQSIGLFPHWTVARNIAAVPRLLGWPRARIEARIDELIALLGLPDGARDRYPHALSGGQQQRVGVARALAADPEVLLMDEPFGALDPPTREGLQAELARIHASTGKTIVFVTHDMDEALRLGTAITVLRAGRVEQTGPPRAMLADPANDFVRDFVGGADRGLRLLGTMRVAERVRADATARGEPLDARADLRHAVSLMAECDTDRLPVVREGRASGALFAADIFKPPSKKAER